MRLKVSEATSRQREGTLEVIQKHGARAAGPVGAQQGFPGIPQLAALWKLEEEAGLEFSGPAFGSVEEGPGPLPDLCEEQCIFVSLNHREALQRVHLAYSAGFWARVSLETFTDQVTPLSFPDTAAHFIVLRACGIGGYVRFASREHFNRLRDQIFAGGLVAVGFESFAELDVFCQGARITVPPLFVPC